MKTIILNFLLPVIDRWLAKLGHLDFCRVDIGQPFITPATVVLLISISCRIDRFM